MALGMILRKTVHSACPTKGSLMSEGIRGFLHLQIKKPNLYPELLHPVNGIVTSKNTLTRSKILIYLSLKLFCSQVPL